MKIATEEKISIPPAHSPRQLLVSHIGDLAALEHRASLQLTGRFLSHSLKVALRTGIAPNYS